jgi:hypothetical protein
MIEKMNKEKEKKERLARLSEAIEDQPVPKRGMVFPIAGNGKTEMKKADANMSDVELIKKEQPKYEDIVSKRKIDIPKCYIRPYNGRIFVTSVPADETITESGIILPFKMKDGKDGHMKDIRRYFVVAFDDKGIPPEIAEDLYIGKEVNPFLPNEAEEWSLPKVVDWHTGTAFECIHYTELAGGNMIKSEKVSD